MLIVQINNRESVLRANFTNVASHLDFMFP